MLTSEDIQKFLEVLATKQDVEDIKKKVGDLEATTHALVNSIDKLAKAVDDLRIEYSALALKLLSIVVVIAMTVNMGE